LHPEIQRQIDDVLAGRSTSLSLGSGQLTEVQQEIRKLTGLRSLALSGSRLAGDIIKSLPPWLDELPNLEEIRISYARITEFPTFLPHVRWSVDAQQILIFGSRLDLSKIFAISIDEHAPQKAIQHIFDLGRSGALELAKFSVTTLNVMSDDCDLEMARK
jgi:Leucine-rich repeat (LRR) protein